MLRSERNTCSVDRPPTGSTDIWIVDFIPGADHSAGEFRRGTDLCTGLRVDPACTSPCEIDPRPWEARHFTATSSHRDAAMAEAVSTSTGAVGSHVRSQVWRPLHLPAATAADVVLAGARDRRQTEAAEGESICGCGSLTCRGLPAQRCMIGGLAIKLPVIYAACAIHLRNL
jgi:hypothetical protein